MLLSLLLACPPSPEKVSPAPHTDSAAPDTDTAETAPTLARGTLLDGRTWTATLIDGAEPWGVVVVSPQETKAPAPVVIALYGGLSVDSTCLTGEPDLQMTVDIGAVEVRLLGGAQCCGGVCSQGTDDVGGEARQQALRDVAAFAQGTVETVGGQSLAEVSGVPIDPSQQVMLMSSAVAHVGLPAIGQTPAAFSALHGIALFEIPIHSEGLTKYFGLLPWDQDNTVDSSGSGCSWDDGGNPWIEPIDCAGGSCTVVADQLAWSDTVAVGDLALYAHSANKTTASGMLFLDGDQDGVLTLSEDGHPDRDGSGAIEREEDFPLPGLPDEGAETEQYWQSVSVLEAAIVKGVLSEDAWPAHLHTLDETRAFWAARGGYDALSPIVEALPGLSWQVVGLARDHGIAQCSRPHLVSLYNRLSALGANVQFNPSGAILEEVLGQPLPTYTPLPLGAPLNTDTVQRYTPPPSVNAPHARTAAVLELLRQR